MKSKTIKSKICLFCKGNLQVRFHEYIGKIRDQLIVISDLPAMICDQCHEAYYENEAINIIEVVRRQIIDGVFLAKPLAAGSISAKSLTTA